MASPKLPDSDLLEWTIDDAPAEGELRPALMPVPQEQPTGPRRTLAKPRQIGLIVVVLAGLAPLGLWLPSALGWQLTQSELRRVVAAEEQAALNQDANLYKQFNLAVDPSWVRVQAAPLPLPFLRPATDAGRVQSIAMVAQDLARVDVARPFIAPDGVRVTFVLPQFYQYRDGVWKRAPTPEAFWGEPLKRSSPRLVARYYPVDTALVGTLLPDLETMLAQACQAWACPAGFKITLHFYNSAAYQSPGRPPALPADDPLLFALLPPHVTRLPGYTVLAPSPQAVGYPVDAAGQEWLRRAVANQVLFAAADQLIFAGDQQGETGNAYFYALIARMAARVGADSPRVLALNSADAAYSADKIWGVHFSVWRRPEDMRSGLVLLNHVLRGQPFEAETRLFHTVQSTLSLEVWLAQALNISAEAARAQIARADPYARARQRPAP